MQTILRTEHISKIYHGVHALQDVSIRLDAGKIYGLIGQNGAGKTTLMRMITGLSFPDAGSIELFGHADGKVLQNERRRLGSMIEHPSLVPNMTAKENLRFHRLLRGIPNVETEDELLELVGLADTGRKKARDFSLGMQQRLGIAVALLGNPELLILDEPVNGLDPMGIVEIRKLLKKLCEEQQMTILISSHNLPELYQTATDYIIIHKGKILQSMTLYQLDERCRRYIHIRCDNPEKLTAILEMKLGTKNYQVMPDKSVKLFQFLEEKDRVAETLYNNGLVITNLSSEGDTLEDYFISLIGGGRND